MTQNQINALRINNAKIALRKGLLAAEAGDVLADPDDIQLMMSIVEDYMSKAMDELEGRGTADEEEGDQK